MHAWFEGGGRVSARRPRYLFFASPKKSTQKKGDPQSATPSRCEGVNLHRVGCGVRRGTHCAAVQLRSDIHGESVHEARALRRACHPATAPTQAQPAGGGQPNIQTTEQPDIHSGHCCARPRLRSARRLRPRSGGASEAMACVDVLPPVPLWMRRGAQGLADQGSRVSERRAAARVERDLVKPEHRRLPRSVSAGDADSGVALSLVPFFRRRERKGLACRATPGLRP